MGQAVAEAAKLAELPHQWSASQWYNFTCIHAVASYRLADRHEEHAARAVELLRKAVAVGFRDRQHMERDAELDPLRGRPDFHKLLNSLPEPAPQPRPAPEPRSGGSR